MNILTNFNFDDLETKVVENYGKIIKLGKDLSQLTENELSKVEIAFYPTRYINDDILDKLPALKWIQIHSDGYDNLDIESIKRRNINVSFANGVYSIPIAEDVLAMMLMFSRKIPTFIEQKRNKVWNDKYSFIELKNKKVVTLGTGDIAKEIAIRAKAFGMKIVGYNRSGKNNGHFDEVTNDLEKLYEHLTNCTFFVVALPLDNTTFHLVDEEMISKLNEKSYILNIGRGSVIDETALIKALEDKKIAGAGLDVFEKEPLEPDSKLWELDNVYLSPHVAGGGEGDRKRLKELFLYNLSVYPNKDKMKHLIEL